MTNKTMNRKQVICEIATEAGLSMKEAEKALNAFQSTITKALMSGADVTLTGFGTFKTNFREERIGRNPMTGETILVEAKRTPAFKPGKSLKDAVAKKI